MSAAPTDAERCRDAFYDRLANWRQVCCNCRIHLDALANVDEFDDSDDEATTEIITAHGDAFEALMVQPFATAAQVAAMLEAIASFPDFADFRVFEKNLAVLGRDARAVLK